MNDIITALFGNGMAEMYGNAVLITLKITLLSTVISYLLGIPLGVLLYGTAQGSIFPNRPVNAVLGFIVNMIRSIPFIILLVLIQPFSKALLGTKIGDDAFIFYLVFSAVPFVARMVESSLKEVNTGVIEAAHSMGSGTFQLIWKVLLPEAKPSLIVGGAIAATTILGYTPMTYLIAGGGLGQLAIQYGLYRFQPEVMYIASILLIILVQLMQEGLSLLAKKLDKRIRR